MSDADIDTAIPMATWEDYYAEVHTAMCGDFAHGMRYETNHFVTIGSFAVGQKAKPKYRAVTYLEPNDVAR